jgi:tRNA/rRNA methyltransferase
MEDRLGSVTFVLCRPRNPQNVGAAARALRNAGIGNWAIVDPSTLDFVAARRVAVHAEELLDKPRLCTTLPEALQGCVLSVGTTGRPRAERPLLAPADAAARLVAARGRVAVVFGDERSGMTAEEADAVDLLSAIPSAPEQPSWNLAQAIAIYAYEVRMAALRPRTASSRSPTETDPAALAAMDRALAEASAAAGKPRARRRLFKVLERGKPSSREAALWTAFLRAAARRSS